MHWEEKLLEKERSWIISEVFQGLIQGWFLPLALYCIFASRNNNLQNLLKNQSLFLDVADMA